MRILHTSDWHLGRTLEGRSRIPEQREFIDELCDILEREEINLVIVAGDVFDTYNPSAMAEELFFEALEKMAGGGRRAVVVIAGNHDSPERLRAANPLACRQGIYLFGIPGENLLGQDMDEDRVEEIAATREIMQDQTYPWIVDGGPGWIELKIPNCEQNALLNLLPYPSEKRLNEVLTDNLCEKDLQQAYSKRVALALQEGARHFRPDTVNIVVSHIFVLGGRVSDSERDIQLGGAFTVDPIAIPENAHYTALGHLHGFQKVGGTKSPCYYSGSPLAYSFSETIGQKRVIKVEVACQGQVSIREIPIRSGKPMYIKRFSSYQEAYDYCSDDKNQNEWLHIEIESDQPLSNKELEKLNKSHKGIVYRKTGPQDKKSTKGDWESLQHMSVEEQFQRFVAREMGVKPSQELMNLFLKLLYGEGDEDETNQTEI